MESESMKDQTKLPWDVKQQCLWIVRGYERARRDYLRQRLEILNSGGDNSTDYLVEIGKDAAGKPKYEERRAFVPGAHNASRTTENIAMRLDALEKSPECRKMRAVEHARAKVGDGMPEALRDALQEGIMLNCQNGRKYPFERLYIVGLGRSEFYRIRDAFFLEIAKEVGIW
jgi:hypothetical protein